MRNIDRSEDSRLSFLYYFRIKRTYGIRYEFIGSIPAVLGLLSVKRINLKSYVILRPIKSPDACCNGRLRRCSSRLRSSVSRVRSVCWSPPPPARSPALRMTSRTACSSSSRASSRETSRRPFTSPETTTNCACALTSTPSGTRSGSTSGFGTPAPASFTGEHGSPCGHAA